MRATLLQIARAAPNPATSGNRRRTPAIYEHRQHSDDGDLHLIRSDTEAGLLQALWESRIADFHVQGKARIACARDEGRAILMQLHLTHPDAPDVHRFRGHLLLALQNHYCVLAHGGEPAHPWFLVRHVDGHPYAEPAPVGGDFIAPFPTTRFNL